MKGILSHQLKYKLYVATCVSIDSSKHPFCFHYVFSGTKWLIALETIT
jgi:hypothetical protein